MKNFLTILLVVFFFCPVCISAQEICNNGVDDDADGLIDLNDTTECNCNGIGGGTSQVTSIIPNASFEQSSCCPNSWSQMNCASGWIQASGATSDYMNTCGWYPNIMNPLGLVPFPNGNGCVGAWFIQDWKEYVGSCLSQPMLAGVSYTLQFNIASFNGTGNFASCTGINPGPVDVVLYGSTNCNNQPFAGYDCPPSSNWMVLGSANYVPGSVWGVLTITFVPPVDIAVITLGAPCNLPSSYPFNGSGTCMVYMVFDNLLLNTTSSFSRFTINQTGTNCQQNIVLNSFTDTSGGSWQWYQNGIALAGQTNSTLNLSANNYGEGVFTAMYSLGGECQLISDTNSSIPLVVNILSQTNDSCGMNNGSAVATASGGIGNLNYSWNTNPVQSTPIANNLFAGNYIVTVTDSLGCVKTASVTIAATPVYNLNNNQSICNGQSYTINSHSYTVPGTYIDTLVSVLGCDSIITTQLTINPDIVTNNSKSICFGETYTINSHSYNTSGIYYDTIASVSGCDSIVISSITVIPLPVISFSHPPDICVDAPALSLNYATPAGGYYEGDGVINNFFNPQSALAGMHQLDYFYTDPLTNCSNTSKENITVRPLPAVEFLIDPKITFIEDPVISFSDLSQGSKQWLWDFDDGTISINKSGIHFYLDTGYYNISLTITDDFGCKNSSVDLVYIAPEFSFFIPNSFTPNGDGKNDYFNGLGVGIYEYNMVIFNRWGSSIFQTTDINQPWNGIDVPEGTYEYKISLKDALNFSHEYVGHVSIIR